MKIFQVIKCLFIWSYLNIKETPSEDFIEGIKAEVKNGTYKDYAEAKKLFVKVYCWLTFVMVFSLLFWFKYLVEGNFWLTAVYSVGNIILWYNIADLGQRIHACEFLNANVIIKSIKAYANKE